MTSQLAPDLTPNSSELDSLPEQPTPSRVNTTRRKLYLHHTNVVAELAGKDEQFKQASARAFASDQKAEYAQNNLSIVRETEANLSDQLDGLRKKKLRNKLFPKKATAEQNVVQQNLVAVSEDLAAAKYIASRARETAQADALHCDGLRADAEMLEASERKRRGILEIVFGGADAGSAIENSIEVERDRLAKVTYRAKDKLSTHKKVYVLLKQAAAELVAARKSLWDAQLTSTVDLFSGGGIGLVAGLGSQYNINMASKQAHNAGEKIQRAVEINPKLPITKLAKVQDGIVLAFADIVLDGFVTDLLVRLTIEKSVRSVDAVMEAVTESLDYQKSIVERLDGRVRSYSDDLKRTSEELVRVRENLLQEIIY